MKIEDISWAAHVPLVGGFPIGAEKILNKAPSIISGYGFKNDNNYINYQNKTLGRNVPLLTINEDGTIKDGVKQKVNIVVGTPPCSSLSMLNSHQNNPLVCGADAESAKWLYYTLRDAAVLFDCDVLIVENAPNLYTNKGKPLANRLYEIAKGYGYSASFYKTSTHYHGIPQARDRTFFFMWKSKAAPILPWFDKEHKSFSEYLSEVTDDMLHQELVINKKLMDEPCFRYLTEKLGKTSKEARELCYGEKGTGTAFNYINDNGMLEDAFNWANSINDEKGIKFFTHAKKKFADNKGIWDGSTHCFKNRMNALIGRNMSDSIHPIYDRSLTIREALHMMGMPHNYELLDAAKSSNMIGQNVPTCTAADMVFAATKWLCGELEDSGLDLCYQNNHTESFDTKPKGQSLDSFF